MDKTSKQRLAEIRELAQSHAGEAIKVLVQEMLAGETGPSRTRAAAELLLWAFGPPAKLEADAQPEAAELSRMPPNERIEHLRAALDAEEARRPH